jgi:hypothetical protein
VLSDDDLSTLTRSGRIGGQVQADLDDIAARHLDLAASHRAALLGSLGGRADDRG